jgi:hypothetical protein
MIKEYFIIFIMVVLLYFIWIRGKLISIFINKNNNKKERAIGACRAPDNEWTPPTLFMQRVLWPKFLNHHFIWFEAPGKDEAYGTVLLKSWQFDSVWFFSPPPIFSLHPLRFMLCQQKSWLSFHLFFHSIIILFLLIGFFYFKFLF